MGLSRTLAFRRSGARSARAGAAAAVRRHVRSPILSLALALASNLAQPWTQSLAGVPPDLMLPESIASDPETVAATVNGEPVKVADLATAALDGTPLWHSAPLGDRDTLIEYVVNLRLAAAAATAPDRPDRVAAASRARYVADRFLEQLYYNRRLKDRLSPGALRKAYDREMAARSGHTPAVSFEERRPALRKQLLEAGALELRQALVSTATIVSPVPDAPGVLGMVNGEPVRVEDIAAAEREGEAASDGTAESKRLRAVARRIAPMLAAQAARKVGLADEPAVKKRLAYLELKTLAARYVDKEIADDISEAAARRFYDEDFTHPQVRWERVYALDSSRKADGIAQALRRGASLEQAAKDQASDDASWVSISALDRVPAVRDLRDGEVKVVRESDGSWTVHRIAERRSKPPFEDVRDDILEFLKRTALEGVLSSLRMNASIEVFPQALANPRAAEGSKYIEDRPDGVFVCETDDGTQAVIRVAWNKGRGVVTMFSADGLERVEAYTLHGSGGDAFLSRRSDNRSFEVISFYEGEWRTATKPDRTFATTKGTVVRKGTCEQGGSH